MGGRWIWVGVRVWCERGAGRPCRREQESYWGGEVRLMQAGGAGPPLPVWVLHTEVQGTVGEQGCFKWREVVWEDLNGLGKSPRASQGRSRPLSCALLSSRAQLAERDPQPRLHPLLLETWPALPVSRR